MVADGSAPQLAGTRVRRPVCGIVGNRVGVWQRQTCMNRRRLVHLVSVAALTVALAACGSDGSTSNDAGSPDTTGTDQGGTNNGGGDTLPAPDGYAHPTGPDDVVIEYSELSGFTTREYAFQQPPVVIISGDGRVFTTGPQIEIYPGPALPNIQVGTITEDAVQQLLSIADTAGLFADIDYTEESMVADASTATVTMNVDGATWVHSAYALGIDEPGKPVSPERAALREFTAQLSDLAATVGADQLGPVDAFVPENYLIQATEAATPVTTGDDGLVPTVVDWPATAGVALADAADCAVVAADAVGDLFTNADQLTYFDDGGVIYQVTAVQQLPQRSCG